MYETPRRWPPEQKVWEKKLCAAESSGATGTIIVQAPAKVAGLPEWTVTRCLWWRLHYGRTSQMKLRSLHMLKSAWKHPWQGTATGCQSDAVGCQGVGHGTAMVTSNHPEPNKHRMML
jgi:hypothetical protein